MARIVMGVGGGIAAYKAVDLASRLRRRGEEVRVVMTHAATRFVAPLSFEAITGEPVLSDLFAPGAGEPHIAWAAWADAVVVAPATADLLGQLAHGLARDALGAVLLATRAPVWLAPAMHHHMWDHPAVAANVERLRAFGYRFVGPVRGRLASGEEGWGRMAEPAEIAEALNGFPVEAAHDHVAAAAGVGAADAPLAVAATGAPTAPRRPGRDLAGRTVLVTAGPTVEPLDPVRYLSNRSSGRMGWALAEAARDRGARVVLVSGPVRLPSPQGVDVVRVGSAREMRDAVMAHLPECDALVAAAAVADYRPETYSEAKIKKEAHGGELTLTLVRNPDVLAEVGAWRAAQAGAHPVLVGFKAETGGGLDAARNMLVGKRIDLVVGNDVTQAGSGFGSDTNQVALVTAEGEETLPLLSKREVAERVWDRIQVLLPAESRGAGDA